MSSHAQVAGVLLKVWMFVIRLSCSGRAFHVAFATQAQEAFVEGAGLSAGGVDSTEVRQWAKVKGIDVKHCGRVPAKLVARFQGTTGT